MKHRSLLLFAGLLFSMLIVAGCRQSAQPTATPAPTADDVQMNLVIEPDPPTMGDATLVISFVDKDGNPVDAQSINVRGDMTHAGMVPVTAEVTEKSDDNTYRVPLNWSMGGDWIVTVDATLADGRKLTQEYNITVAS